MKNTLIVFQIFFIALAAFAAFYGDYIFALCLLIYERTLSGIEWGENKKKDNNKE